MFYYGFQVQSLCERAIYIHDQKSFFPPLWVKITQIHLVYIWIFQAAPSTVHSDSICSDIPIDSQWIFMFSRGILQVTKLFVMEISSSIMSVTLGYFMPTILMRKDCYIYITVERIALPWHHTVLYLLCLCYGHLKNETLCINSF